MKKIILLITLLTASGAVAALNDDWYSPQSVSCESGVPLKSDSSSPEKNLKYKISADFTELTVDQAGDENGDEIEVTDMQVFTLQPVGKMDGVIEYMAIPQANFGNTPDSYFFISSDAGTSQLTLSSLDRSGSRCNGGLVLTSLAK